MRKSKADSSQNADFKRKWAKLCVFCPDPFAGDTEHACRIPHEPWSIDEYAYLLPEGVARLCDELWKVCRKHRTALEARALLNVDKADACPF